jgi:hypothetical protein
MGRSFSLEMGKGFHIKGRLLVLLATITLGLFTNGTVLVTAVKCFTVQAISSNIIDHKNFHSIFEPWNGIMAVTVRPNLAELCG